MADEIRATPRSPLFGLFSDIVNVPLDYMSSPERSQQMQGLASFIRGTGVPYTLQNLSYDPSGRGLFTGAGGIGGTTRPRPEAVEAAMTVAPMVGPVARMTKGLPVGMSIKNIGKIDQATGLPLNPDGTVTLFHHTNKSAAEQITKTGRLKSAGEPSVYLTTQKTPDTGYGDVVVPVRVKPSLLNLDDEFPGGRMDFSIDTGKPKGSIPVTVEKQLFEYPQEEALRLAQQRAALPVEQGGLGLPAGNTAQQRLDVMFPSDVYHGSKDPSIMALDPSLTGKSTSNAFDKNIWSTSSPEVARGYSLDTNQFALTPQAKEINAKIDNLLKKYSETYQSGKFDEMDKLREQINVAQNQSKDLYKSFLKGDIASEGATIYPLRMNVDNLMPYEASGKNWMSVNHKALEEARSRGYSGVNIKNVSDNTQASNKVISDTYATENPDFFRSRFAAGDPFRRNAAIAAIMGVAAPDLLASPLYTDPFANTIGDTTR